jgi:hypothetical protein
MGKAVRVTSLTVLVLAWAGAGLVLAQAGKTDSISYINRATKKEETIKAQITEESPAGVKVKIREGKKESEKLIPAADITYIEYTVSDLSAIDFRRGFSKEANALKEADKAKREKLLAEAALEFSTRERAIKSRSEARRYLQFKSAMTLARLAQDDPSRAEDALKRLMEFTKENRSSWQIVPALETQARMLEEAGKEDEAREAYEALALLPDIPREVTRRSEVLMAKLYLRAGKPAEAQKRLELLNAGLSAADAEKPFVEAYLAEARLGQGKLDGLDRQLASTLKSTSDNQLRAVLHNLLGELHLKKGANEEAFWHFLRVDALYNEVPEEQARALFHLGTLFDKVRKDPVRGRECHRRLAGKAFEGTRYQKMLPKGAGEPGS